MFRLGKFLILRLAPALLPALAAILAAALTALAAAPRIDMAKLSTPDAISGRPFGRLPTGGAVTVYTLRNRHGMQARIATYGGIVISLTAPDRAGHYADVVLGYDTLAGYLRSSPYFGALIGRYANRIAGAQFTLDGTRYRLAANDGPNALHGGRTGFDKVIWTVARARVTVEGPQLELAYISRDGEEGYPGKLAVSAIYTLIEDDALRLDLRATSDKETVVNLTNHSYFNLRGRGDILGHIVQINAGRFTPVDATLIPTGVRAVEGTPFDFLKATPVGGRIDADDEQLRLAGGYDHNWVLNTHPGTLSLDATVYEPETGRVLEISSTQPGLQFYSGNFLDGSITGKRGWTYQQRNGFCMEPQHFPDSPNHPDFPSTALGPGQTYRSTIVYRFSAR